MNNCFLLENLHILIIFRKGHEWIFLLARHLICQRPHQCGAESKACDLMRQHKSGINSIHQPFQTVFKVSGSLLLRRTAFGGK